MGLARKLVRKMTKDTGGYVPNVGNLDVRPGTILTRRGGRYDVVGALWERAKQGGDVAAADVLEAATTRVDPNNGNGDVHKHALGLKYKAGGTIIVASRAGFAVDISDVTVQANIKVEFKRRRDYLFDTTKPSPWYTFSDTEMDDVTAGALRHLDPGELVVIGVIAAEHWLWYVSKRSKTMLAFAVEGGRDIEGLGADKLADISASAGLNVVADSSAVVHGQGVHGVAAFRVIGKSRRAASVFGLGTMLSLRGEAISGKAIDALLGEPTDEDLRALVALDGDDDDDDDD